MKYPTSLASWMMLAGLTTVSATASAASGTIAATVANIQILDSVTYPNTADWFQLNTAATGSTNCGAVNGMLAIKIRGDDRGKRMLSLLTSAMLAGKTVSVFLNDATADKEGSYCFAQSVVLSP